MKIGNRNFDTDNHCYIMGILNVTPDSFSDGGRFDQLDAALRQWSMQDRWSRTAQTSLM